MAYEVDMAGRRKDSREAFFCRLNAVLHKLDSSHDIESMDVVEVLYLFCKHDQLETAGSPRDGFAYMCPLTDKLQVIVRSEAQVSVSVDASVTVPAARLAVCDQGVQFVSVVDLVVYTVKGLRAVGSSEGEAALCAFAKLQLPTQIASRRGVDRCTASWHSVDVVVTFYRGPPEQALHDGRMAPQSRRVGASKEARATIKDILMPSQPVPLTAVEPDVYVPRRKIFEPDDGFTPLVGSDALCAGAVVCV